jgi:hypothetical protein
MDPMTIVDVPMFGDEAVQTPATVAASLVVFRFGKDFDTVQPSASTETVEPLTVTTPDWRQDTGFVATTGKH